MSGQRVPVRSNRLATKSPSRTEDELDKALAEFHGKLTLDEKARFQALRSVPDASSVMALTAQLDQAAVKRRGRCVASRLSPLLSSIQQFSSVVGTFVSSNPAVAALVWGSMEFMLRLANNSFPYFDSLSSFLMKIERYCPRFAEYQALYDDAPALQSSLLTFYAEIVRCCTRICEVLRRDDWLSAVRNAWTPFSADFGPFEAKLQTLASIVKEEVKLAEVKASDAERKAQDAHRKGILQRIQREDAKSRERSVRKRAREELDRRRGLLDRLSNYDYRTAYRQSRLKCHLGTAEWLHAQLNFQDWLSSDISSACCITGKLGCGKTILLYGQMLCLTFSLNGPHKATTILRSIIRQCLQAETLPQPVDSALASLLDEVIIQAQDLLPLLQLVLSISPKSYLVLDGIEECADHDRRDLLRTLMDAISGCSKPVKFILTSRHIFSFKSYPKPMILYEIRFDESAIRHDISIYVADILREKQDGGELVIGDPCLASHIQSALVEGANGMFLWVALQIAEICDQTCDEDIRKVVSNLPISLEETYIRMFLRIAKSRKTDLASLIFKWVAVAKRPLQLYELQEALAVEKFAHHSKPDRLIVEIASIIPWCRGFLVLDEIGDEVYFAHPTVKDILTREGEPRGQIHFTLEDADKEAGEICVTYLNFNDFKTGLIKRGFAQDLTSDHVLKATSTMNSDQKLLGPLFKLASVGQPKMKNKTSVGRQLVRVRGRGKVSDAQLRGRDNPFMAYASEHWLSHSSAFSPEDRIWTSWRSIVLSEHGLASLPWTPEEWSSRQRHVLQYIDSNSHAALLALIQTSMSRLSRTQLEDLLHSAAKSERHAFVHAVLYCMLVEDVVAEALYFGAKFGYTQLVEHSLAARADDELIGDKLIILTMAIAVKHRQLKVVERLLADTKKGESRPVTLESASESGNYYAVGMLLAAGADVESVFSSGRTALQAATECGWSLTVKKILEAGPSIDMITPDCGETALQIAAKYGSAEIVSLLIFADADINLRACGKTPLQLAAGGGHFDVVEILLLASFPGQTALQSACSMGNLQMVNGLLAIDSDVNAVPTNGDRALKIAAGFGHSDVVQALIAAGAGVNDESAVEGGQTALKAAVKNGHWTVAKLLLSCGANVKFLDHYQLGIIRSIYISSE